MSEDLVRVLVVEDELDDFVMAKTLVERMGLDAIRVDWRPGYSEALEALSSEEYNVCLLDFFLEQGSGLDLLREYRAAGGTTPVIMLTGKGSREVDHAALEAGADGYVVKGDTDPVHLGRTIRYAAARSRGHDALRARLRGLEALVEEAPVGHFRVGRDGRLLHHNPALGRLLGDADPHRIERHYVPTLFVHPDHRERFVEELRRKGRVERFESRLLREDGGEIRVRTTARLRKDGPEGAWTVGGWVEPWGVGDASASAPGGPHGETHFDRLLHLSPQAVALVGSDGRIRKANAALGRYTGSETEALEGRMLTDLAVDADRETFVRTVTRLARGEAVTDRGELRIARRTGDPLPVRYVGAAVGDPRSTGRDVLLLMARSPAT